MSTRNALPEPPLTESPKPTDGQVEEDTRTWESRLKLVQDTLSLSKELLLLGIGIVCLCFLLAHWDVVRDVFSHFSAELKNAKINEIDVAGVKVSIEDSAQKLETAKISIDSTKKQLQELADKTADAAMKSKLEKLLGELDTAATAANSAQEGIQTGIHKQEQALGGAPSVVGDANWIIVVSAD